MNCFCRKEMSFFLTLFLCSCTSFPAHHPSIENHFYESEEVASVSGYDRKWWEDLHDSAITILVEKAIDTNPTLEQALAQIDEAKAQLEISKSEYFPTVGATSSLTRNFDGSTDTGKKSLATAIGPSLSWEIDLFGRVRNSNKAAKSRLNARTADARNTRNILASSVARAVFDFRACRYTSFVLENDVQSHREVTNLIHKKKTSRVFPPDGRGFGKP